VEADHSPVIARRLGVQNIVSEGFQELAPKFAQVPDALHFLGGIEIGTMEHFDCAILRQSDRFNPF
jgi:hypothetical protein